MATNSTLQWDASNGATSYEYCIDITSGSTCDSSWVGVGTNTSVPLSGLSYNTIYYWQVRANNIGGTTSADGGTWWSFTTAALPSPGSFNKTAPSNGATSQPANPTLSWGTSSNATSYEYCIDTTNNSSCNASWISTAASTSVGLSGLSPTTIYYWQVRANNLSGTTYANNNTWWSFMVTQNFIYLPLVALNTNSPP